MAEFTLRLRRYDPESGDAAYWEEHTVELEPHRSVLEGILQAKATTDGSIGIRCSCRAAICGSCGVRVNGQPGLACHTHLDKARRGAKDGVIVVEPMGNMPVIKDLIVDMDAVHWKKIQRVTPWLQPTLPVPEREYVVPHEAMVDVTQSMACIQCGACVSDCLSMEVDPGFIGPAALAKAYRFVGDPRDASTRERLEDLSTDPKGIYDCTHCFKCIDACVSDCLSMEVDPGFIGPAALAKAYRFVGDPRDASTRERLEDLSTDPKGIYDCTHCFKCIDACPKGVAPMSQIMRLRRRSGSDFHIEDPNNGERHERSFVSLVRQYGLLNEAEIVPRSYGGDSPLAKFKPPAAKELASSLPTIARALLRRKVTPKSALMPHKLPPQDLKAIRRIYGKVEDQAERLELNLYITGDDEELQP